MIVTSNLFTTGRSLEISRIFLLGFDLRNDGSARIAQVSYTGVRVGDEEVTTMVLQWLTNACLYSQRRVDLYIEGIRIGDEEVKTTVFYVF